jgi:hypothetical protein
VNLEFKITGLSITFLLALASAQRVEGTSPLFSDGFENGLNGWQIRDSDPAGPSANWGVVDSAFGGEGAHGGTNKLYCAGQGYIGTPEHPFYVGGMAAYASRVLDLSAPANATLRFWYLIPGLESPYDSMKIFIDDEEIWSRDTAQPGWVEVSLSLNAFTGSAHVLSFAFFSDFAVNFEGCYLDDISVTDETVPGPPRINDNFAAAQLLAGARGSIAANNRRATSEPGEPANGSSTTNSVWFSWTAPADARVTFTATASGFDPVLCVYTGKTLASLFLTASNITDFSGGKTNISFEAAAGVVYFLSIRGAGDQEGPIQLSWNQPGVMVSDRLPDLTLWADPIQKYLYGWYLDFASAPGRTLLRLTSASVNIGAGPLELIGSAATPQVLQRVYRDDGSFYDRPAGTATFHPEHGHIHFDDWMEFNLRSVLPQNGVGEIVAAGAKTSSALIDLQVYDSHLPGFPTASHYHGGLLQGISVGWADVYGADLEGQSIDITGIGPGQYWLEEIIDPGNAILEADKSNNSVRIMIALTAAQLAGTTNDPGERGPGPFILADPLGTNLVQGSTLHMSVEADGALPLTYQWRYAGMDLSDDGRISGATTSTLSIANVSSNDSGPYNATISNSNGYATSATANLIVLDNPRAIYFKDATAVIGGTMLATLSMLSAGDEHSLGFSLLFDPAILQNPAVVLGADASNAVLTVKSAFWSSGAVGVTIDFPAGAAVQAGLGRELLKLSFEVTDTAKGRIFIGFGDDPQMRAVITLTEEEAEPIYAAASFELKSALATLNELRTQDGGIQLAVSGLPRREYALETTTDLGSPLWRSIATNLTTAEGLASFSNPQSGTRSFYRARLLPRTL